VTAIAAGVVHNAAGDSDGYRTRDEIIATLSAHSGGAHPAADVPVRPLSSTSFSFDVGI
jgi:hypothetical protein